MDVRETTPAPTHTLVGPPTARRFVLSLVRAAEKFWEHGDLFASAAISFYALFSLLPLVMLFLAGLQLFFPYQAVQRNLGRLFGMTTNDVVLQTIRSAYAQEATLGWVGAIALILAAGGVFTALQVALDRVWECRGRFFHTRFFIGVMTMAASLLIFLAMLIGTVFVFRLIRTTVVGEWLGWPRVPGRGAGNALTIATGLAQFGIFWIGYRFLPNAPVRWRDALPGAAIAAILWHAMAYVLAWYLGTIADYSTLYHSLSVIIALLVWVYGLTSSFMLGAEIVAQHTRWPQGRGGSLWQQPLPPPTGQEPPAGR
jgi:membrane protein